MRFLPAIAVLLGGCVLIHPFPRNAAYLNDISVRPVDDAGYEVVEVDGKPVKRAASPIHTVVPKVVLKPGERTLTLKPKGNQETPLTKVTVTVEAGKGYRLKQTGDAISIIEEVADRDGDTKSDPRPNDE